MASYLIEHRYRIFVKGYGFSFLAKSMSKIIGEIMSKNLSAKSSQKLFDIAKQSATDALKLFQKDKFQK